MAQTDNNYNYGVLKHIIDFVKPYDKQKSARGGYKPSNPRLINQNYYKFYYLLDAEHFQMAV